MIIKVGDNGETNYNVFDEINKMFSREEIFKTLFQIFFGIVFTVAAIMYFLPDKKAEFKDNPNIILIDGQRYLKLDKD